MYKHKTKKLYKKKYISCKLTTKLLKIFVDPLLQEKLMSGKLVLEWSHASTKEIAKTRYLTSQENTRLIHAEIANLFFSEFSESDENSESEAADEPAPLPTDTTKDTPFNSTLHSDVTYSNRHIEEAWIHLLKAGDTVKLRTLTVCNFDFLLAAVSSIRPAYHMIFVIVNFFF